MIRKLFAKSPVVTIATGLYLAVAAGTVGVFLRAVFSEFVTGSMFKGLFGTGEGLAYGVFKTQFYLGLFALTVLMLAGTLCCFLFIHAGVQQRDFDLILAQEKRPFYRRPGFWVMLAYNAVFVGSGLWCLSDVCNAGGVIAANESGGMLLAAISLPLIFGLVFCVGIVAVMCVASVAVSYFHLPRLVLSAVQYIGGLANDDATVFSA